MGQVEQEPAPLPYDVRRRESATRALAALIQLADGVENPKAWHELDQKERVFASRVGWNLVTLADALLGRAE